MSRTNHLSVSTGARLASPPLFDPLLYRALRKVARREIGTMSSHGALRHRTDELPGRLSGALSLMYRNGFITLSDARGRDGWIPAELTLRGTQLLSDWLGRAAQAC